MVVFPEDSSLRKFLKTQHLSLYVNETSNSFFKPAGRNVIEPRQCLILEVRKHCIGSPRKLLLGNTSKFHTVYLNLAKQIFYRRQTRFVF